MSLFLFFQQPFEASDTGLQVAIYLQIPGYNTLHLVDVLFDVLFFGSDALRLCNQLAFLVEEFGCLADVFDVFEPKLVFFFKKTVDFFMESKQIVVDLVGRLTALAKAKGHSQVVHFLFMMLRTHHSIVILVVLHLRLHHLCLLNWRFSWLFLEPIF